jgi:hypothetical protein
LYQAIPKKEEWGIKRLWTDGQGTLMGIDELIENYPIAIVHP